MGIPIEVSFPILSGGLVTDDNAVEVIDAFRIRYKENAPSTIKPFDGIAASLAALASYGVSAIVVTSKKTDVAWDNLKSGGIARYVLDVVGSDRVRRYKPDPDPINVARSLLPRRPDREIMIGDADVDVLMGQAAGVETAAVTWGAHSADRLRALNPDHMLCHPSDIAVLGFRPKPKSDSLERSAVQNAEMGKFR